LTILIIPFTEEAV